ncbi:hypothetical protein F413_gp251 [Escherichia phage ime09]|uniref:Uncharacterized protein n=2 Tax=Tequatrovirus TaxID=10663 RepID=G1FH58_9CAUD|nr:hypothetical protein F413_gp251 [Escherichia phage ime09]YP_010094552.1 hypothetical protein KNT85_gp133 [Enterobacteria phage vB_EcoM_IME339]AEK12391.1 hypothetical protein [Escherichia phage ime09]AWD91545.1 hypothetical protein [Enterobacteria phage vB_EcoM_IME339]EKG9191400.1 hypothetical protein [Shigella flexneri]
MNIEDKEMRELYNSLTPEQQKAAKELEKALSLSLTKTDWAAVYEEKMRSENEAIERNEWIVNTKISSDGCSVEVSAVVKGTHGEESWGWHNEANKYIVLSTSKTYGQKVPVSKAIIKQAQWEANEICLAKMK